jgi:hypothetical protein
MILYKYIILLFCLDESKYRPAKRGVHGKVLFMDKPLTALHLFTDKDKPGFLLMVRVSC